MEKDEVYLENFKLLLAHVHYEGKLYWDRYNLYLILNSGLMVALIYVSREDLFLSVLIYILGFFSAGVWFLTSSRSFAYFGHWIKLARQIEENDLKELTFFKKEEEFKKNLKFYQEARTLPISLLLPLSFSIVWFSLLCNSSVFLAIFVLSAIVLCVFLTSR